MKENSITVTVNLKQNKTVKNKFEISGQKGQLDKLVAELVEKATALVK